MTALFDGHLPVHYGFAHLLTNGSTGSVPFTVAWSTGEPVFGAEWDEIVEVPIDIASRESALTSFEDLFALALPAVGLHRARYCASDMAAGKDVDTARPGPDRYLLQLWPAAAEPDRIVRHTSAIAAYWHQVAQDA